MLEPFLEAALKKIMHLYSSESQIIIMVSLFFGGGGSYTTQHVKSYSPTRIEPVPPTLKGQSLNHWASREVLELWVLYLLLESFC